MTTEYKIDSGTAKIVMLFAAIGVIATFKYSLKALNVVNQPKTS